MRFPSEQSDPLQGSLHVLVHVCFTLILICLANFGSSCVGGSSLAEGVAKKNCKPTLPHLGMLRNVGFTSSVILTLLCGSSHLACWRSGTNFVNRWISISSTIPSECDTFLSQVVHLRFFLVICSRTSAWFTLGVFHIH